MGSLDAGLAGLFDYLLKDREAAKALKRDDDQFEKRERLRARIGLDTKKEEYSLTEKRGTPTRGLDGTLYTPILDGAGKEIRRDTPTPEEVDAITKSSNDAKRSGHLVTTSAEEARVAPQLADLKVNEAKTGIAATNQQMSLARSREGREASEYNDRRSGTPTPAQLSKGYFDALNSIGTANDPQAAVAIRSAFQMEYNAAATPEAKMQVIIKFSSAADRSRSLDSYQQQKELRSLSGGSITPTGF